MAQERYVIRHERAEWVVRTLIDAWRRKLPPFDHAEPVPGRLPRNLEHGSVEHGWFLLSGQPWMRGRVDSAEAYKRLVAVYEEYPEIFNLYVLAADPDGPEGPFGLKIRGILLENGLGFGVRDAVRFWFFNAKKIVRFWGGNPVNIFWGTKDYSDLCRRFLKGKKNPDSPAGFLGFREKMVSMFIYFLERAQILRLWYHYPGPVDTHNNRVLTVTECITVTDGEHDGMEIDFYAISPYGREIYFRHCRDQDEVLDLADAMWYLSRDFCQQSQGNSLSRRISSEWAQEVSAAEHEGRRPNKRKKHVLLPVPIVWTEEKIAVYNRTCGVCCLESVCEWSLPSAPNYGETREPLIIRGRRPKPHIEQEVLIDVPKLIRSRPPKPLKDPPKKEVVHPSLFD